MLSQLVYVSHRSKDCNDEDIQFILESCKRNNPSLGITGVLLYDERKFIQLVEGEKESILSLYGKIKKDMRHQNCVMISFSEIESKSFPAWHMGCKEVRSGDLHIDTDISSKDKIVFERIIAGEYEDSDTILNTLRKFFDQSSVSSNPSSFIK